MTYEIVKYNYQRGLWSEAVVKVALKKGIITKEQFEEITSKTTHKEEDTPLAKVGI